MDNLRRRWCIRNGLKGMNSKLHDSIPIHNKLQCVDMLDTKESAIYPQRHNEQQHCRNE